MNDHHCLVLVLVLVRCVAAVPDYKYADMVELFMAQIIMYVLTNYS